jgi:hypothetical protein
MGAAAAAAESGGGSVITERGLDELESGLRSFVRQLVLFDQGHRVTETLEAARQDFRAVLKRVLGMKIEERADG